MILLLLIYELIKDAAADLNISHNILSYSESVIELKSHQRYFLIIVTNDLIIVNKLNELLTKILKTRN